MSYSVRELPETERPRERLLQVGVEALTLSELIAIILGSGTRHTPVLQLAGALVAKFGTLEKLAEASVEELCQVPGMGQVKAIQLKAAIGLGRRTVQGEIAERYRVEHPAHAYQLVRDLFYQETRELFVVILLDVKGGVMGHQVVSIGTLSRSLVHPREVFFPAVRQRAASIILSHNHPSGDPTPSQEDYATTEALIEAGKTLGIPVRDHLIVGAQGYISLRQKGTLIFT